MSPISHTAQKDWYYQSNESDKTSIEHVYSGIENSIKPVLIRLQNKDYNLTNDEVDLLFIFVVSQLMRTPKAANAMGAVLDLCIRQGINVVCEEVYSGLRSMSNLPMQASISIPRVAEYLSGKGYLFVENNTSQAFLLSDNPVCLFSPVSEIAIEKRIDDRMFVQSPFSGYMLFMPLGPSLGIICYDDDYYDFGADLVFNAIEEDIKKLNDLEVLNASKIIMYKDGSFNSECIKEALQFRETEKYKTYQNTIYTPVNKNFSLLGMKIDENVIIYKINRYAIEKRIEKTLYDLLKQETRE